MGETHPTESQAPCGTTEVVRRTNAEMLQAGAWVSELPNRKWLGDSCSAAVQIGHLTVFNMEKKIKVTEFFRDFTVVNNGKKLIAHMADGKTHTVKLKESLFVEKLWLKIVGDNARASYSYYENQIALLKTALKSIL